jgi:hypothetical protein
LAPFVKKKTKTILDFPEVIQEGSLPAGRIPAIVKASAALDNYPLGRNDASKGCSGGNNLGKTVWLRQGDMVTKNLHIIGERARCLCVHAGQVFRVGGKLFIFAKPRAPNMAEQGV